MLHADSVIQTDAGKFRNVRQALFLTQTVFVNHVHEHSGEKSHL